MKTNEPMPLSLSPSSRNNPQPPTDTPCFPPQSASPLKDCVAHFLTFCCSLSRCVHTQPYMLSLRRLGHTVSPAPAFAPDLISPPGFPNIRGSF